MLAIGPANLATGDGLSTYKLALATTVEFTNAACSVSASCDVGSASESERRSVASAALDQVVAAVNEIYRGELAIQFELVPQNDLLISTGNTSSDGYTDYSTTSLYYENSGVIEGRLNSSTTGPGQLNEYDLGHVLALNAGGGLAGLGVVGRTGKAQGVSSVSTPLQLNASSQVVPTESLMGILLHEIGHQFGAEHSFNGVDSNCVNREPESSWEPGSGSTIMGYQNICGTDNLTVEPGDERYFHAGSFDEIKRYIDKYIPDLRPPVATGNTVPNVQAGPDYTIPASTPFALTAFGSDLDVGDNLTYTWEQIDIGPRSVFGTTEPLTTGGLPASTSTTLNTLDRAPDEYSFLTGDVLPISGYRPDGTAVSANYVYSSGDTVQDLLDALTTAFNSPSSGGAVATLDSDGTILLTANEMNVDHPAFDVSVDSSGPPQLKRIQFAIRGQSVPLSNTNDAAGPLFRSFAPTSNPTRVFPRWSDLLAGTDPATNRNEHLPTQSREINFRVTVRDNHDVSGQIVSGIHSDDLRVHVVDTGQAFRVTSPNTAVIWDGGTTETVTWNVAGTDGNGIDTATVNIRLSTDGGNTFPIVLGNFPNNGSADIRVPHLASTTSTARLMVEAAGNVFFDVSDQNFTINSSVGPGVSISQTESQWLLWEDAGIVLSHYQVALDQTPAGSADVSVRVTADPQSEISLTGQPGSFASVQTLVMSDTTPQSIYVRALEDVVVEGTHTSTLRHAIVASDDLVNYPTDMAIANWTATIVDNDAPPIVSGNGELIGVDFDPGNSSIPPNWTRVDVFSNQSQLSALNLTNEAGQSTAADLLFIDITGGGGSNPSSGTLPTHSQSLAGLGGVLYSGAFGGQIAPVQALWADLNPGAEYEVYVFGLENFAGTFDQHVTITGSGTPVSFDQVTTNSTLWINGEVGSSARSLESYAQRVTATEYGTIEVRVEANSGSAGIVLAGLAVREIIPSTKISSIAGSGLTQNEGSGSSTPFTFTVTRTGDTSGAATVNYSVTGIGGNPVDANDFGGTLPSGQVQFLAGQSVSEPVTLSVSGDTNAEGDERFAVLLSSPSDNARLDVAMMTGTINNDDQPGQATISQDTIGLYQGDVSLFHLKNSFTPGAADQYFAFGPGGSAGWIPLAGDWDGDGTDTIGLYQPDVSLFHLKNTFTPGASDQYFAFGPGGNAGWTPLVGDWNGDGIDTIGLYQPDLSLFHLKDSFTPGASDQYFAFGPSGNAGWIPLSGDWNGDGVDTVGFYQPDQSLFHLKDSFTPGASDHYFAFGPGGAGWTPLVGDWNGDQADTIGLYQPDVSLFHLKDSFTPGASDQYFAYGPGGNAGWIPLTGDWNGPEAPLSGPPPLARPEARAAAKLAARPSETVSDTDTIDDATRLRGLLVTQPGLASPVTGNTEQLPTAFQWEPAPRALTLLTDQVIEESSQRLAAIDHALRLLVEE